MAKLLFFSILFSFTFAKDPVTLYHGTDPFPLQTMDMGSIPYVSLFDFTSRLGYDMRVNEDGVIRIDVSNRVVLVNPAKQQTEFGWKTLPTHIKTVGVTPFIRVDSLTGVFSQVLGSDLIYEPTSRCIHLPKDEDLRISLKTHWQEEGLRLSLRFSHPMAKPRLYKTGRYLVVSLSEPHLQVDSSRFRSTDAVPGFELFGNLPDRTSEIHFQLGTGVEKVEEEPYLRSSTELGVRFLGAFRRPVEDHEGFSEGPEITAGLRTIVIDPGHGGRDEGARGPTGLKEKTVTLDLARKLKRVLEDGNKYQVILTRNTDFNMPLKVRTGVANNAQADLFISIHLNAINRRDAWGSETFYLTMNEDEVQEEDAFTIEFENTETPEEPTPADAGAESNEDPELQMILWDLAQTEFIDDSFRIARYIQQELNELAGIRNRGVKQAPLTVLKGARMPAILVEVAFISNPREETKLKDSHFKNRIVQAIARAIERYDDDVITRSKTTWKRADSRTSSTQWQGDAH